MPTLHWIGKEAVVEHHKEVPFHLLREEPALSAGDPVEYDRFRTRNVLEARHQTFARLAATSTLPILPDRLEALCRGVIGQQAGEFLQPFTNITEIKLVPLAIDDALNIADILRPAGNSLVDDQVLCRTEPDCFSRLKFVFDGAGEKLVLVTGKGYGDIYIHAVRGGDQDHPVFFGKPQRVRVAGAEILGNRGDQRSNPGSQRRLHSQVGVDGQASLTPDLNGQPPDHDILHRMIV